MKKIVFDKDRLRKAVEEAGEKCGPGLANGTEDARPSIKGVKSEGISMAFPPEDEAEPGRGEQADPPPDANSEDE